MKSAGFEKRIYFMLRIPTLFVLWLFVLGSVAYGQGTATIVGTVTDPSGAVVPNAQVTITDLENGFVRTTTSNTTGNYSAPELTPGKYQMKVEASGFKTYDQNDITLEVGSTVRINPALQVGTVGQSVTVEASALQVQADTSDVSQTITSNQIENLATNGRNVLQLTTLVPGASSNMPDFDSPGAQFQNRNVYFNGMRQDANNWLIDGGEAYDRGGGGILLVSPSQDALQEFTVATSNYAADLGNSSGGMINMAVKSGTKRFHGGAWWYGRNDAFDAYSYLSKQVANPTKPELRYNTFGFNLGGPLAFRPSSNPKTFFFYNQEWRREINGGSIFNQVPTAAQLAGNMTGLGTIYVPNTKDPAAIAKFASVGLKPGDPFPNNTIPASLINANAANYIKAGYFLPPNASDGVHYFSSANTNTNYHEEVARVDHQFNEKYTVFARVIYDSLSQGAPRVAWSNNTFPTIGSLENVPSWAGVVHLTMNLRPNLLNEAAFNENGNNITIANTGLWKTPSDFVTTPIFSGANTINKIPGIDLVGNPYNVNMDNGNWPWTNTWRSNQGKDDLSWTRGAHNFKFGGAWLHGHKNQKIFVDTAGTYKFDGTATAPSSGGQKGPGVSLADFLLGDAASFNQGQLQDFVSIAFDTINAYALDNFRVNKQLTLNLGLRWEGLPHAYDTNNRASNFYPELYNPALAAQFTSPTSGALDTNGPGFTTVPGVKLSNVPFYLNGVGLAGRNGIPRGLVNNHWDTFAPRVGFAYDVYGNGKTILRGGFGVFYERNGGNEEYNMGANVPFSNSGTTIYPSLDVTTTSWIDGAPAGKSPTTPQGITGIQKRYPITGVYQYNLGLQQQVQNNMVFTLAYVGNASDHLSQTLDINTVPANDPNRIHICGGNCGATGGYNANYDRPYRGFGSGVNIVQNQGNAHYDGLQGTFRATAWHNLTMGAAYTFSHAWDVIDAQLFNNVDNPMNPGYQYGTAGFDRRNIAVVNFDYAVPFFQNASGLTKSLAGGWTISGVALMQSGNPISVNAGNDNLGFGGNTTNHADIVGNITYPHTFKQWFSPNAFAQPAPLTWGNSPKNIVKGPGRDNWNLSLYKDFHIKESMGVQLRAETFNTWNHTQFTGVNNSVLTGNSKNPYNSTAGQITGIADPRVFQFAGRFYF